MHTTCCPPLVASWRNRQFIYLQTSQLNFVPPVCLFFSTDILKCHRRKCTGVTDNINNSSITCKGQSTVSVTVSQHQASPDNTRTPETEVADRDSDSFSFIIYTRFLLL